VGKKHNKKLKGPGQGGGSGPHSKRGEKPRRRGGGKERKGAIPKEKDQIAGGTPKGVVVTVEQGRESRKGGGRKSGGGCKGRKNGNTS